MLQAAIAGLIVFLIIKFLEKGEDRGIDGWVSFVFVLIPALLTFLLSIAVGLLGLPQWLILIAALLYLIIPALMLRFQFDLPWGLSSAYGGVVFFSALVVDIGFSYGLAAISA